MKNKNKTKNLEKKLAEVKKENRLLESFLLELNLSASSAKEAQTLNKLDDLLKDL
jgi:hypothetical protein